MLKFCRYFFLIAICFSLSGIVFAQSGSVSGTVTSDINNQPLAGVSIEIPKLKRSAETDENGNFEFSNLYRRIFGQSTECKYFRRTGETRFSIESDRNQGRGQRYRNGYRTIGF